MQQQDQTSEPAEVAPNQLDERDIYEEVCNNSQIAKLFQAEDLATFVDELCKREFPLIDDEVIYIDPFNFESAELQAALENPASELR